MTVEEDEDELPYVDLVPLKRGGHGKNRMYIICYVDLKDAHTKKMTSNKTKNITDYCGGRSVHKFICSGQLGS